jgi:hypothetical protein
MLKVLNPSLTLPPSIPSNLLKTFLNITQCFAASLKVSFTGSAFTGSAFGFPHYTYLRKKSMYIHRFRV